MRQLWEPSGVAGVLAWCCAVEAQAVLAVTRPTCRVHFRGALRRYMRTETKRLGAQATLIYPPKASVAAYFDRLFRLFGFRAREKLVTLLASASLYDMPFLMH